MMIKTNQQILSMISKKKYKQAEDAILFRMNLTLNSRQAQGMIEFSHEFTDSCEPSENSATMAMNLLTEIADK